MTDLVIHSSCPKQEHAGIVGPLHVVQTRAVLDVVGAVEDLVVLVDQTDRWVGNPIPGLLRPVQIRSVMRISAESCSQIEEAAIRDGIPVRIPIIEREDLPLQPTGTRIRIPARLLPVEHRLCQRKPLRLIWRRVGKRDFGG